MNQEIKEICHAIADKKGVLIKVLNVRSDIYCRLFHSRFYTKQEAEPGSC